MENVEIARALSAIADLLEIRQENSFKVRAYRTAVRTIGDLTRPLAAMVAAGEDLTALRGIGKDMAGYIRELIETDHTVRLDRLEREVPGGVAEFMHLDGIGPDRALQHPCADILAHPTGRIINERPPFEIDLDAVLRAAAERDVAVELNAQPHRLDLNDVQAQRANELGVRLAISTDAHSVDSLDFMHFGIDQAAGLDRETGRDQRNAGDRPAGLARVQTSASRRRTGTRQRTARTRRASRHAQSEAIGHEEARDPWSAAALRRRLQPGGQTTEGPPSRARRAPAPACSVVPIRAACLLWRRCSADASGIAAQGRRSAGQTTGCAVGMVHAITFGNTPQELVTMSQTLLADPQIVDIPPARVVQTERRSDPNPVSISRTMGDAFAALGAYAKQHSLRCSGPPRAIYTAWGEPGVDVTVAMPIAVSADEPGPDGDVHVATIAPRRALRFTHYGPYEQLPLTYDAITEWLQANGRMSSADDWAKFMPMWEEYLTDPATTRPSDMVTNVYLPVD